MLSVLVEGTLTAAPVARVGSKGNAFTTARMRAAGEDGETVWCSVIAFKADAAEALAGLTAGDAAAIAGHATVSTWEKNGTFRAGLRITATRVLTVYDAGQRRKAAARRPRSEDEA